MDTVKWKTDSELKKQQQQKKKTHRWKKKIRMKREKVVSLFINRVEFFFF